MLHFNSPDLKSEFLGFIDHGSLFESAVNNIPNCIDHFI